MIIRLLNCSTCTELVQDKKKKSMNKYENVHVYITSNVNVYKRKYANEFTEKNRANKFTKKRYLLQRIRQFASCHRAQRTIIIRAITKFLLDSGSYSKTISMFNFHVNFP